MARILIPKNNAPWNPNTMLGDQKYANVLKFHNGTKIPYVGREMFDDISFNYEDALNDKTRKSYSFSQMTPMTASITVDLNEIVGGEYVYTETIQGSTFVYNTEDMLNVNVLFINEYGKSKLWMVRSATKTSNQNQVSITYTLEPDIFFNEFEDLDIEGEVVIKRAHTNRHNGTNFLTEDNRVKESILTGVEKRFITKHQNFKSGPSFNDIGEITWVLVYVSLGDAYNSGDGSGTTYNYKRSSKGTFADKFPFNVYVYPTIDESTSDEWGYAPTFWIEDLKGRKYTWGENTYNRLKNDSNVIAVQKIKTPAAPFPATSFRAIKTEEDDDITDVIFQVDNEFKPEEDLEDSINGFVYTRNHIQFYHGCRALRITDIRPNISQWGFNIIDNMYPRKPDVTIEDPREIGNELKMQASDLVSRVVTGKNSEDFEVFPEYFTLGDEISRTMNFKGYFEFNPNKSYGYIYPKDYELFEGVEAKDTMVGYYDNSKLLPTEAEAYEDYISSNMYERNWDRSWGTTTSAVGGAANGGFTGAAIGSMILPGIGTAIGGGIGAGLGLIGGVTGNIVGQNKKEDDLKRTPHRVNSSPDNWISDQISTLKTGVMTREVSEDMKEVVYDGFHKIGYEINKFLPYDKYLENRYYFNFIQTDDISSRIKNRLSNEIKAEINNAHLKGFTVWHVRDLETFKGINNYNYENLEMDVYTAQKTGQAN